MADRSSETLRFFEVPGTRLAYVDTGSNRPVLLLIHELGASHRDWERLLPLLAMHFRVIAPDLRGHGASSRTAPYTVPQFAADLHGLLDHLGVAQCLIAGHSMGGAVAMQMTLTRAQRTLKLVLANTLPSFSINSRKKWLLWFYRVCMMRLLGPSRLARAMARKMFPDPSQSALREQFASRNAKNSKNVYLALLNSLPQWSIRDHITKLSTPILLLASEWDYFPVIEAQQFAEQLANAELILAKGARHALHLEQPEWVAAKMQNFLLAE